METLSYQTILSVLSPLTNKNEETDEGALSILNKRRKENSD